MIDDIDGDTRAARDDIAQLTRGLADASQAGALLGKSLAQAFDGIVLKGKDVSDVFSSIALSLSESLLKSALQPLQSGISGLFSSILGGVSAIPFARGGVLRSGTPVPFADGGVIASPIAFPLAGGRTGLAGEAGPEAIVPLRRGADGRLGVAVAGGGTTAPITINITATDVESFRRSETQVAALLARAVARGQRNL